MDSNHSFLLQLSVNTATVSSAGSSSNWSYQVVTSSRFSRVATPKSMGLWITYLNLQKITSLWSLDSSSRVTSLARA